MSHYDEPVSEPVVYKCLKCGRSLTITGGSMKAISEDFTLRGWGNHEVDLGDTSCYIVLCPDHNTEELVNYYAEKELANSVDDSVLAAVAVMDAIKVMIDGCLTINEAMDAFSELLRSFEGIAKEIDANDGE